MPLNGWWDLPSSPFQRSTSSPFSLPSHFISCEVGHTITCHPLLLCELLPMLMVEDPNANLWTRPKSRQLSNAAHSSILLLTSHMQVRMLSPVPSVTAFSSNALSFILSIFSTQLKFYFNAGLFCPMIEQKWQRSRYKMNLLFSAPVPQGNIHNSYLPHARLGSEWAGRGEQYPN